MSFAGHCTRIIYWSFNSNIWFLMLTVWCFVTLFEFDVHTFVNLVHTMFKGIFSIEFETYLDLFEQPILAFNPWSSIVLYLFSIYSIFCYSYYFQAFIMKKLIGLQYVIVFLWPNELCMRNYIQWVKHIFSHKSWLSRIKVISQKLEKDRPERMLQ